MTPYRIAHEDLETKRQGHTRACFDELADAQNLVAYLNAIWPGQVRFWVEEVATIGSAAPGATISVHSVATGQGPRQPAAPEVAGAPLPGEFYPAPEER